MTHLDAPPAVQKRPESRHPDRLPQASESHPARPPKVSRTRSRRQRATCGTLAPDSPPGTQRPNVGGSPIHRLKLLFVAVLSTLTVTAPSHANTERVFRCSPAHSVKEGCV